MDAIESDISVRELAEFVHRTGNLGGQSGFQRSNRALEGIKGHKRIQQSRGNDYRSEVPVEQVAATWSNLLPSCIDCNRMRGQPTIEAISDHEEDILRVLPDSPLVGFLQTGKGSSFPIKGVRVTKEPDPSNAEALFGAEEPFLLNPCRDDPSDHIVFHIDRSNPVGFVYPHSATGEIQHLALEINDPHQLAADAAAAGLSERGAVSIYIFGLNRLRLVQERTRILLKLEFLGESVRNLYATADALMTIRGSDPKSEGIRLAAIKCIQIVANRTLAEIQTMAAPEAPYSTMVLAWIAKFKATI